MLPLDQTVAPIHYEGDDKHDASCPCEACVPYLRGDGLVPLTPRPARDQFMESLIRERGGFVLVRRGER